VNSGGERRLCAVDATLLSLLACRRLLEGEKLLRAESFVVDLGGRVDEVLEVSAVNEKGQTGPGEERKREDGTNRVRKLRR
jgi:hypothetical protein